jgi:hypothetical protein
MGMFILQTVTEIINNNLDMDTTTQIFVHVQLIMSLAVLVLKVLITGCVTWDIIKINIK